MSNAAKVSRISYLSDMCMSAVKTPWLILYIYIYIFCQSDKIFDQKDQIKKYIIYNINR